MMMARPISGGKKESKSEGTEASSERAAIGSSVSAKQQRSGKGGSEKKTGRPMENHSQGPIPRP